MKYLLLAGLSATALLTATTAAAAGNNSSAVTQTGSGAIATVTQSGSNSNSTVSQSGGGTVTVGQSGSRGSTSTVTTSADDRPPESTVTVSQTDNGGTGTAVGKANLSTVIQDNVNGFGASGTGSTVSVSQNHILPGAGSNTSYVQQGRNAVSGQVTVSQVGGDNSSYYASTTSTDNDAIVTQFGRNNSSTVLQNFQNGSALATVNQVNVAGGAVNSAYIEQASAGFSTAPAQFAVGADAVINQIGSGNSSSIVQTGYSPTESLSNLAVNTQVGDNHVSTISQGGFDNTAIVTQTSNGNLSTVLQGGNSNQAFVTQASASNTSWISQGGNNNVATVTQGN